ncbi:uncharacterized protein L3040_005037 [Drepanopeziza brunnea f. sp. 'multigermtubi']|uniref:uncharacterized protein n=1 Tax=Drepanopeziza brunnea f. sp. 'multigermtubi' TaxID=698441 RepID=UPI00239EFA87|nr:hypothetical protein L3040_005037 [Drepanopeziza brunnea f. sp. 'multigermtubi']
MTSRAGRSSSMSQGSIPNGKACRFCAREFAKTEHLIRHERCHTKERPFQCSICGKNYSRNDTLIRHRRTHGNNTTTVPPDVFSSNDAATTSDGLDVPDTPQRERATPNNLSRTSTSTTSTSHVSLSTPHLHPHPQPHPHPHQGHAPVASMTDTDYQSPPIFDGRALDFESLENQMFGHDMVYPVSDLVPGGYHNENGTGSGSGMDSININITGMPQIDPGLGGAENQLLDGSANLNLSSSFLDPALSQYPQHASMDGFPPIGLSHMPYVPPQVEQFQSWLVTPDFDLAAFNKLFVPPTAAEFLGVKSPPIPHQWKDHEMPSPEISGSMVSLREHWDRDLLPSIDVLNIAIQLFFTGFNPIFPIFHAPTFRSSDRSEHSELLLLSICSIGTLFMGSDGTTLQAAKMFETVHQHIEGAWEQILNKPMTERKSFIQAGLISQVFAYLSGNPKYVALVKNMNMKLIDLARRCELLDNVRSLPLLEKRTTPELDGAWESWARAEEVSRTALALYILDAQFASTFHTPPVLQHNESRLPVASNDELFAAATPTRWAHLVRLSPEPSRITSHLHINQPAHNCTTPLSKELTCKDSRLSASLILHSISASVQDSKAANSLTPQAKHAYEESLICWYHAYEETRTTQDADPLCLMILYHEIFMTLLVDFRQLEAAIANEPNPNSAQAIEYARSWATSKAAKRCIIHASLIHRQAEGIRYDAEPALHVPRSMFMAARAWYCYIHFDSSDVAPPPPLILDNEVDLPEIKMFNVDPLQYLPGANGYGTAKPAMSEAATLVRLTDLLEQVGHWGISRRFAFILRGLIYGEQHQQQGADGSG